MGRKLAGPSIDLDSLALPISKGGTGGRTAVKAAENIGLVTNAMKGVSGGVVAIESDGYISTDRLSMGVSGAGLSVQGPVTLSAGQVGTYTITDFDSLINYTVSAVQGTVSRSGATITYTAGGNVGAFGFKLCGKPVVVNVVSYAPAAPTITSPTNGATGRGKTVTITASAFGVVSGSDTHAASDWQLATDSGFTTIVQSSVADTVNKTSWTTAALTVNTTYYARVRYKGTSYGYGGYSAVVSFTTASVFVASSEQKKLLASDPAANDDFGNSVSISADGSYAIVGAYNKSSSQGAAYIFLRSGTTWTQQAKLLASDPAGGDWFGCSVSISADGSYAIVGAFYKTGGQGGAYVFLRSGTTWTQQAKLLVSDPAADDEFGISVSISSDGGYAVVGAHFKTVTYAKQGAAYIFSRSGTTWTQQAKLLASDPAGSDYFGYSVSISSDGSYAIVGACYKSSWQGAAYVFLRSGTTWTQQAKLLASDPAGSDYFGWSVSISANGSYVVVGAYGKSSSQGAAYIFLRSGTTWTQQAKLLASDPAADDYFGYSVSISADGSYAIVGARIKTGTYAHQGAAYIFLRSGTTWTQQAKLLASDPAANDDFGASVSISADGSYAVVGAYLKTGPSGSAQGAAYIYA